MAASDRLKTYDREFWIYFIGFVIIVTILCFLPIWITRGTLLMSIGTNEPNEIGDSIGGTLGPFVGILASALTFLAFWVQYKANQHQRFDLGIERFENKFYEMLALQRSNIDEMNIEDRVKGRTCFVRMFYELRCVYEIVSRLNADRQNKGEAFVPKDQILDFAYALFFWGVGVNQEKNYAQRFDEAKSLLLQDCRKVMVKCQDRYDEWRIKPRHRDYYTITIPEIGNSNKTEEDFYYRPFDGHSDILSHYYRHLYQTVGFVVDQRNDFLDRDEKYPYVKTIRAQLSSFEQLLLYYNALAWFEGKWYPYFTEYCLIKNIPMGLADFEISPTEKYAKEITALKARNIDMFE